MTYTIQTKPIEYLVERKLSDFFWLRGILCREYPGVYIPPTASKSGAKNFEKDYLEKRLDVLQKFLNALCEHDELRSSPYFSAFLKFSHEGQFDMLKEELDKKVSITSNLKENFSKKLFEGSKPLKITEFRNKDGQVKCRIAKHLRDYAVNADELRKQAAEKYDNMKEICKELVKDVDKTVETVNKLCDQLTTLSNLHKKFNDVAKEGKWELMQKIYDIMSHSLQKWGGGMKKNVGLVEEHLFKTFKYSRKEYDPMNEIIEMRNLSGEEYYKAAQDLEERKSKILLNPDPNSWGIDFKAAKMTPEAVSRNKLIAKSLMFPAQTSVLNEMKSVFGYFNHMMVQELSFLANSRTKRYIRAMNNFCSDEAEINEYVDF